MLFRVFCYVWVYVFPSGNPLVIFRKTFNTSTLFQKVYSHGRHFKVYR